MLGGYTGSSVGRPDGFLNDWHGADLLCTETSQQFDWPAAWLVGYGGMLAALDSPSLCWHVSPASQLSLAVDKELFMPNLKDIGHRLDKSSCWLALPFNIHVGLRKGWFGKFQNQVLVPWHTAAFNHRLVTSVSAILCSVLYLSFFIFIVNTNDLVDVVPVLL